MQCVKFDFPEVSKLKMQCLARTLAIKMKDTGRYVYTMHIQRAILSETLNNVTHFACKIVLDMACLSDLIDDDADLHLHTICEYVIVNMHLFWKCMCCKIIWTLLKTYLCCNGDYQMLADTLFVVLSTSIRVGNSQRTNLIHCYVRANGWCHFNCVLVHKMLSFVSN